MNFVPLPASVSKVTLPPIASVNLLTVANPNPCPLAFVVINGVNILLFTFSGMPSLVSCTLMVALLFLAVAFMVSFLLSACLA